MGHVSTSTQRTLYFLSSSNYLPTLSSAAHCRPLSSYHTFRQNQLRLRKHHTRSLLCTTHSTKYIPFLYYTNQIRCLQTENNKPSVEGGLPLPHIVPKAPQLDFTQTAKHVDVTQELLDQIKDAKNENLDIKSELKTDSTTNSDKATLSKETKASEKQKSSSEIVDKSTTVVARPQVTVEQLPILTRVWNATKGVCMHYYDGSRLFVIEFRISWRLFMKILNGKQLTRREKFQLERTVNDLFRLVPLVFFVLIPFMELLLPVALKLFPNLLPSTFESIDKKKEKKLKKLKLKLDLAKFIQDSMVSSLPLQKGQPKELKRFSEFIARTRSKDPRDDIEELVSFSQLFSDHLTLDTLSRKYVVALCQLLNLRTFGTETFLRFQLRNKMKELKEDDIVIRSEGLDNLTPQELQQANTDRGMRAVGVSKERLRLQLDQWLKLRLDNEIPVTLLLLSRIMTLPTGPVPSYEDLRNAVAHLPDSLIGEAKISLAAKTGEMIDNRSRLDAVRLQEELIAREQDQQKKKDKMDEEIDRKNEELKQKEIANTRVAANIQMKKETLKDMARPILTEDQIEVRRQEVADIMNIISGLRAKKNPLLEEKEELREVIENALLYQIKLEDKAVVETKRNHMLAKRVANMLNKSHKVLTQLEDSLKLENVHEDVYKDDELVLKKSEIRGAINEILNMDTKHKLLHIVEILSDPSDGTIKPSEVLKALEKIAVAGTDLNAKEISVVLKIAKIAQPTKMHLPEDAKSSTKQ